MRVDVESISKRYGRAHILKDVSFTIPSGQVTGLLGPNGSGKSTLMRMLLGLGIPDSGTVRFNGRAYQELENPGSQVGALLDASARHPGRTVRESLRLAGSMIGTGRERCDDVIEQMGLQSVAHRRFKALSLGMRQRVGLGIAILGKPSCLVLDEPVNGLDIEAISWLRGLLSRFAEEGGSVLVSSHLLQELQSYAHRVVIIDRGRVAAESSLAELADPSRSVRVQTDEPDRLSNALLAHGLSVTGADPDGWLSVQGDNRDVARIALDNSILVTALESRGNHHLESAYLRLTQGEYSAQSTGVITR